MALLFCELLGFLGLVILIEGLVHITFNFSRPFFCLSFPCSRLGTYWKAHWCPLVKEEDQANREACLAAEGSLSETICPTLLFRAHTLLSHWRACLAWGIVGRALSAWNPGLPATGAFCCPIWFLESHFGILLAGRACSVERNSPVCLPWTESTPPLRKAFDDACRQGKWECAWCSSAR